MSKAKVTVILDGGLVQEVITDVDADYVVIDLDTQGAENEEITQIDFPSGRKSPAYIHLSDGTTNPQFNNKVHGLLR